MSAGQRREFDYDSNEDELPMTPKTTGEFSLISQGLRVMNFDQDDLITRSNA